MRTGHGTHGFTLIEILVVVSIIGVLSSVVLAALQSARASGRIGADVEFSSANYQALGAQAYGVYHFDGDAKDSSGNNNDLTLHGSAAVITPGIVGSGALSIPGTGTDYAVTTSGGFATMGSTWTVSGWVNVTTMPGTRIFISMGSPELGVIGGGSSTGRFYVFWRDTSLASQSISDPVVRQVVGAWHLVTVTHNDVTQTTVLYVDGQPAQTATGVNSASIASVGINNLYLGTSATAPIQFSGQIDDVYVYPSALSAADIYNIYAQGPQRNTAKVRAY